MTVEEHLIYYAQVKGIPKHLRTPIIEQSISQLGLNEHRAKISKTLSGGNKRKLCVAISLLGGPSVILLDEPSAGMDPESRRFMWSVVGNIAQKKTSAVVLTTHSMEEAEALSTKMGILVKGGIFKCFGSSQHIRNKFGKGYVIEIKIRNLDESELPAKKEEYLTGEGQAKPNALFGDQINFLVHNATVDASQEKDKIRVAHAEINLFLAVLELCKVFKVVEVIEQYGNYIRCRVDKLDKSIGFVFGLVEGFKSKFEMSEYSVSQTTLEQIFQQFADVQFQENAQMYRMSDNGRLKQVTESKVERRNSLQLNQ